MAAVLWWVACETGGCGRGHVWGADGVRRHPLREGEPGWSVGRVQCPECGMASSHPQDRAQGYCGNCHWWTSDAEQGGQRREDFARRRELAGRYYDERIAAGLIEDGTPAEAISRVRVKYVRGVLGDSAALQQLDGWAAERKGHAGG